MRPAEGRETNLSKMSARDTDRVPLINRLLVTKFARHLVPKQRKEGLSMLILQTPTWVHAGRSERKLLKETENEVAQTLFGVSRANYGPPTQKPTPVIRMVSLLIR
jgi:hypothetical protein